ncbi:MAG: HAMP domain-containing histidine kinase [Deltaproteobacteria bacterium]|nr:HAMP domain-containing histidine kinase [Deltaproteobacteria bacterium]
MTASKARFGSSTSQRRAFISAVAILVPVAILAVLAWRAYRAESLSLRDRFRRDQVAIVQLVAQRLAEEAEKAAKDLAERCRRRSPSDGLQAEFLAAQPIARRILVLRHDRLIYPERAAAVSVEPREPSSVADVSGYIVRLRQRRKQRLLLNRALQAEYSARHDQAIALFGRAANRVDGLAAHALLGLARNYRALEQPALALRAYRKLRRRFETTVDEAGVSLRLMADAGLAELSEGPGVRERLLLEMHRRLLERSYGTSAQSRRYYLQWVIEQLSRDPTLAQTKRLERLRQTNRAAFAAERFANQLVRYGISERPLTPGVTSAVALDNRTTLVLRRDAETTVGYLVDEGALRRRVAAERPRSEHITLALYRSDQPVPRGRSVVYAQSLDTPLTSWILVASTTGPDPLAGFDQRGRLLHLGLIAGLIIVLAAGLVFTYRGVRRELDLAQLKSDFASNVSHELKTPLTSIRMYAEMLHERISDDPADQKRYQQVIIRESERLGRLIANILDFSRVERGTRRYDLAPIDPAELVGESVHTFLRLLDDADVDLRLALGDRALPLISADREAAEQCLMNLLNNAVKYSPGRAEVRVYADVTDHHVKLMVADSGMGIAAAEQEKIFDEFYRTPQARAAGVEGTGLGLALVRRHMDALGGRVTVESTEHGSVFTLWFRLSSREPQGTEEGV